MKCPKCASDHIQNIRVLFESGTSTISGTATTGGIAYTPGVGPTYGGSITEFGGEQSSLLAQRFSPPVQKRIGRLWWAGAIWCGLGVFGSLLIPFMEKGDGIGGALFGLVLWGSGLFLLIRHKISVDRFNRDVWPGLYHDWSQHWFCHCCGFLGKITLN
jgi:hypothetical protein